MEIFHLNTEKQLLHYCEKKYEQMENVHNVSLIYCNIS